MNGVEMWIYYDKEFSNKLSNNLPVVTVTSNNPSVTLSIVKKNKKGFKIVSSKNVSNLSIDWIAMAKVKVRTTNLSTAEIKKYKKQHQLIVTPEDKQKVLMWREIQDKHIKDFDNIHINNDKAKIKILKSKKTKPIKINNVKVVSRFCVYEVLHLQK